MKGNQYMELHSAIAGGIIGEANNAKIVINDIWFETFFSSENLNKTGGICGYSKGTSTITVSGYPVLTF